MSRISATFSVSLPPEMVEEVERARRDEHRTRSEFVREALRQYIARGAEVRRLRRSIAELPEEEPAADEISGIAEARQAFRQGKFIDLDELLHDMGSGPRQPRRKKSEARSRR